MKAIMISTRPQWVEKILNGIKKDEIRKGTAIGEAINKLIKEQGVAPMLIYCTKNDKQILFGRTRDVDLVDYRGTACYGDFRLLRKGGKLTTDDNQPRLNGKVVARFNATAEEITTMQDRFKEFTFYETSLDMEDLLKQSCLDYNELDNYLQGENGTAIHITNLEIFDKPKEISEFKQCKCFTCKEKIKACSLCFPKKPLTRAPQSWCYVEI